MRSWKRGCVSFAAIGIAAFAMSACSSGGITTRNVAVAEQVQPLPSSEVASANLPAIGESGVVSPNQMPDGTMTTAEIGTPVGGAQATGQQAVLGGASTVDTVETASADGSFVTLDAVGSVPEAPGRDLSGGLTIEKLLGGWTIVSGADQCKLNLTYTSKAGTSRYRASTPGCQLQGLKVVASWQLAGSQVQLFDENGDMIAALILSGNRFIGTLAGGQGISMVG
jgi:Protease inhibitor Inh